MPDDTDPVSVEVVSPRGTAGRTTLQLAVAQRREQALQLRVAGASLSQIAEALRYSRAKDGSIRTGPVAQDIKRAIRAVTAPAAEELRDLELARLDELQKAHWPSATAPGEAGVKAANLIIKIIERRCKLLGIDAPQKLDLSTWLREFAEREGLPYDFAVSAANDIIKKSGF